MIIYLSFPTYLNTSDVLLFLENKRGKRDFFGDSIKKGVNMTIGIPLNFKKKNANRQLGDFFITATDTEECSEEAMDESQLNYIN